mmetsp:Transcript_28420/g.40209  ORF Transcript_28420/g.40209 Transcript_28420/m.40209 type:complete len:225 (+) Transcript_28420:764-1438(+)
MLFVHLAATMVFDPTFVSDEARSDIPNDCIYPPEYEGHFESLMLTREEILNKVKLLADTIHEDYKGKRPVMVCVLKGANSFYQHLLEALQELKHGYTTEFLRVSSYEGVHSSGDVQIHGGLDYEALKGRDVILVEDIVDTGTTLSKVIPILQEKCQPKSIEVCSLLEKRLEHPPKIKANYIGFLIPNHFIIGYGMDYNEMYRDLRDIWVISKKGIDFDQSTLYD